MQHLGRRRWGKVPSTSPKDCWLVLNGSGMVTGPWRLQRSDEWFFYSQGLLLQLLLLSTSLSLALQMVPAGYCLAALTF